MPARRVERFGLRRGLILPVTADVVCAMARAPVCRAPNSDSIVVKAAAKPVPLLAGMPPASSPILASRPRYQPWAPGRKEFVAGPRGTTGGGRPEDAYNVLRLFHRLGLNRANSVARHCLTHSLRLLSGITSFGLSGRYRASASQQRARAWAVSTSARRNWSVCPRW